MRFNILPCLFVVSAQTAAAASLPEICDHAALRSAARNGVPPQVMLAITRVETGRNHQGALAPWPWAVNVNGESFWFDSQEDAADFAQTQIDGGQTNIDLGCFQLNWRWHGENFPSVADMLDPGDNAEYAAGFLTEQHGKRGNWVDAVAAYHSTTPEYAETYIEKVEAVLMDLSANTASVEEFSPDPARAPAPNTFPLLQAGESGSLASLVPSGGALGPVFLVAP